MASSGLKQILAISGNCLLDSLIRHQIHLNNSKNIINLSSEIQMIQNSALRRLNNCDTLYSSIALETFLNIFWYNYLRNISHYNMVALPLTQMWAFSLYSQFQYMSVSSLILSSNSQNSSITLIIKKGSKYLWCYINVIDQLSLQRSLHLSVSKHLLQ